MGYEAFKLIKVEVRGRVAYGTIDNPPINIITAPLLDELVRLHGVLIEKATDLKSKVDEPAATLNITPLDIEPPPAT